MKTAEMPVLEEVANPIAEVDARLRESLKIVRNLLKAVSYEQWLKLAGSQGFDRAEVKAALKYLVETPVLNAAAATEEKKSQTQAAAFDPHEAGRRMVEELKAAEGGAWTGRELQKRFSLIPATLHRRRKEFRIVYWRDAQHNFHYPKWQFGPVGALLPGIQEVLETLQSHDEWRVMRYFLSPRGQLDNRSPLDLLGKGEVEKVLGHTKIHVEENTW